MVLSIISFCLYLSQKRILHTGVNVWSFDGIMKDPVTGSACCALTALLSSLREETDGNFSWCIAQGVEMGRPGFIQAQTEKKEMALKCR